MLADEAIAGDAEIAALSARAQGLRVVPLAPLISIPVAASVAINGERSARRTICRDVPANAGFAEIVVWRAEVPCVKARSMETGR
jgi:hypothetical protein